MTIIIDLTSFWLGFGAGIVVFILGLAGFIIFNG